MKNRINRMKGLEICKVKGCGKPSVDTSQLCRMHYQRKRRYGEVFPDVLPMKGKRISLHTYRKLSKLNLGPNSHYCRKCEKVKSLKSFRLRHCSGEDKLRNVCIDCMREVHLQRKYGITLEEYYKILKRQGYRCALCRSSTPGRLYFQVDHNHKTGVIRGLLCGRCNTLLGFLEQFYIGQGKLNQYLKRDVSKYLEKIR